MGVLQLINKTEYLMRHTLLGPISKNQMFVPLFYIIEESDFPLGIWNKPCAKKSVNLNQ